MTLTPEQRAEIDTLHGRMTDGEWGVWKERVHNKDEAATELALQVEQTEPLAKHLYLLDAGGKCPATTGCGPDSDANAAGIVALKNTWPAASAHIAALEAEVGRLREGLRHYRKLYCEGAGDWCGMLSEIECGGCHAAATLGGTNERD